MTKGNNSSNRGRPYGMLLLLAFGAAVFGVMVVQKLRERRIFNLLVNEKDHQLHSLHLLLQKERDSTKERNRKSEEMRAKIYSLRTQQMELGSSLMEMQSTIGSLKDEHGTMESALEEKQNEIKLLREKEIDLSKENSQVIALTEILKQKEAEIEDLKHRLDYSVNVRSVSTDDPSNPPVKLTAMGSMARKDKTEVSESKEEGARSHESNNNRDGQNSTRGEDGSDNEATNYKDSEKSAGGKDFRENKIGVSVRRGMIGEEHLQKPENSQDEGLRNGRAAGEKSIDEGQGKKNNDSQDGEGLRVGEEKNNANATKAIDNYPDEVWKSRDEDSDKKAMGITRDGRRGHLENSQDGEGEGLGVISNGGMNLEMPDNSQKNEGSGVRGKHDYVSKTKGKRWRIIAKKRGSGNTGNSISINNGAEKMRRRFPQHALESERNKARRELEKMERHQNHNIGLKMRDESGGEDGKLEFSEKFEQGVGLKVGAADQVGWEGREEGATSNEGRTRRDGEEKGEDSAIEVRKAVVSTDVKLLKHQNFEDAEDLRSKVGSTDRSQQHGKGQEMVAIHGNFGKPHHSLDEVPKNGSVNGEASKIASDARRQNLDEEVRQSEDHEASGIQQQIDRRDIEALEVADIQEPETDRYLQEIQFHVGRR